MASPAETQHLLAVEEGRDRSLSVASSAGARRNVEELKKAVYSDIYDRRQVNAVSRHDDLVVSRKAIAMLGNGLFGVMLVIIVLQMVWDTSKGKLIQGSHEVQGVKLILTLSTLLLLWQIFDYYQFQLFLGRKQFYENVVTRGNRVNMPTLAEVLYSGMRWRMLLEMGICAIHPVPYWFGNNVWAFDDKFGLLCFLRLYLVIRVLRDFSPVYRRRREIMKSGYQERGGPRFDWLLCVKTQFEKNSGKFTASLAFVCLLVMSYVIYVSEREHDAEVWTYRHAFWFTVFYMCTVDYGDPPTTMKGLTVMAIIIVLGIIILALTIAVVSKKLGLTHYQTYAISWLDNEDVRAKERDAAARLLALWWRERMTRRRLQSGESTPVTPRRRLTMSNITDDAQHIRVVEAMNKLKKYRRKRYCAGRFSIDPVLDNMLSVSAMVKEIRGQQSQELRELRRLTKEVLKRVR